MAGFDATLGGSAATSYITDGEADALLANTQYNTQWQSNTAAEKQQHLTAATFWLDQLNYAGTRGSPSTDNPALPQALSWPRSGASCDSVEATCAFIPKEIKSATALVAVNLSANPEAITGPIGGGGSNQAGTYVSKQQLGDLVQEFAEYSNSQSNSCDTCGDPAVISAFSWLKDALSCWYVGSGLANGSGLILRVRS